MSKKKNNWNSKKRSNLLKIIFGIPTGLWLIFWLIAMIPDPNEIEPLTWGDFILVNVVILPIWFTISFIITVVVSWMMNKFSKNVEEKNISIVETKNIAKNSDKTVIYNIENDSQKEEKNNKIERKKPNNNGCLHICESVFNAYEYKIMAKYFPKRIYWVFVLRGIYLNLLFTAVFTLIYKNIIVTILFFIGYQLYLMLFYKIGLEECCEKQIKSELKKLGVTDIYYETEFYEDYFIRKSENTSLTIKYSDITRCVENETHFYFYYAQRNSIIIIQKNNCDLGLINFIREKFSNLENHLGDNSKFKGVKKYHSPKFIRIMMLVLFILSIMSLWLSMFTWMIVNDVINIPTMRFIKTAWVIWLWLPIPIISIILGFKYKKAGFKCTKNIVAGFIISYLLLMFGSFCFFPTLEEDYSKIYDYQDIIDLELPSKGLLEVQDMPTYSDANITDYTIINTYYDEKDVNNLEEELKGNNNWILSTQIKSNLTIFIPTSFVLNDNIYYSIYNKTLDEYNSIPEEIGEYEIYMMRYDKATKVLEIHNYNYLYK